MVIASIHARNAVDAVQRVGNSFPDARQSGVLLQLSSLLIASLHQRLLPDRMGGRTMISELLLNTNQIRGNVASGTFHQIANQMSSGARFGHHTLEMDLQQKISQIHPAAAALLTAELAPST